MNGYVFDEEFRFWHRKDKQVFDYSDGDEAEEYLYRVIKNASDKSAFSEELRNYIVDWPSLYHLSPVRHNLLRPIPISNENCILEIGCGCGAITRYLGETGARVIAVEGSPRRAKIAAERCKDLSNVVIICDNFENFEYPDKFDIVTLIGVLEYAPLFINGKNPVQHMLQAVRGRLTTNGVLLVAIENRLGLKYFNGASEDHTGGIFDGINDFYSGRGVITFGKRELENQLTTSGFSKCEFIYPFPDYKLPTLVVHERALSRSDFVIDEIMGQYPAEDYSNQTNRLFYEERVWPVLHQNGLVGDLANSFLVIAHNDVEPNDYMPQEWLANTFAVQRRKTFATITTFKGYVERIEVSKEKMFYEQPKSTDFGHVVEDTPYVNGHIFLRSLPEVFNSVDVEDAFLQLIRPWIHYLNDHVVNGMLPSDFLDCTPMNLLWSEEGNLEYIDREWVERSQPLEVSYVYFRGMLNMISKWNNHQKWKMLSGRTIAQFINDLAHNLAIELPDLEELLKRESRLNAVIYPNTEEDYLKHARVWLQQKSLSALQVRERIDSRLPLIISAQSDGPRVKVFIADRDKDFSEDLAQSLKLAWGETTTFKSRYIPMRDGMKFRIDPLMYSGIGRLLELAIVSPTVGKLWSTSDIGFDKLLQDANGIIPELDQGTLLFVTLNKDAHWLFEVPQGIKVEDIAIEITLEAFSELPERFLDWINTRQTRIQELLQVNNEFKDKIQYINLELNKVLELYEEVGSQLSSALSELHYTQTQKTDTEIQYLSVQSQLDAIVNSQSWKLTKGLRFMGRVARKAKGILKKRAKIVIQSYKLIRKKKKNLNDIANKLQNKVMYTVVISHTDYLKSMGGTEKSIFEQAQIRKENGGGTILLFPVQHHQLTDEANGIHFGLYVNEELLGFYDMHTITKWLQQYHHKLSGMHVHHLLFWQFQNYWNIHEIMQRLKKPITFYAHDFFACCSSYHMIQENDQGSQPCIDKLIPGKLESVCGNCIHGRYVSHWRFLLKKILDDAVKIIVPSIFVKETFLKIYPEISGSIEVRPHLTLVEDNYRKKRKPGKIRLAYLGYRMDNKGWLTWEKIFQDKRIRETYELYHIGSQENYTEYVQSYSYSFIEQGAMAAVNLLKEHDIDMVFLWSIVPESYSFTLQEAIASGVYILTSPRSGNIAFTVSQLGSDRGLVIPSEEALFEFLNHDTQIRAIVENSRLQYLLEPYKGEL